MEREGMTKKETGIEEGNKLIQHWLEVNYGIGFWCNEPLQFHSDFNWQMSVVEKIMKDCKVEMKNNSVGFVCIIYNRDYDNRGIESDTLRKAIFLSCIHYIKHIPAQ